MSGSLKAIVASGALALATPLLSHQPASAVCLNPQCSLFDPTTPTEFRDLPFAQASFSAPDRYKSALVGFRVNGLTPTLTIKNIRVKGDGITSALGLAFPDVEINANNTNTFSALVSLDAQINDWNTLNSFLSFDIDGTDKIADAATITYALRYTAAVSTDDFGAQANTSTGAIVPTADVRPPGVSGPLPAPALLWLFAFSRRLRSRIRKAK
jgi:hypothetical protein